MTVPTVLLFHTLQKSHLIRVASYFSKIYYHTQFQDPKFIAIIVTSLSKVHVTSTLLVLTAENYIV
jgi:hypothetical protein